MTAENKNLDQQMKKTIFEIMSDLLTEFTQYYVLSFHGTIQSNLDGVKAIYQKASRTLEQEIQLMGKLLLFFLLFFAFNLID